MERGARRASRGAARLSTNDPYRAVGKLTFSAGYCSASLIRRSVIVTAAHCIQNFGSGGNIFSGFRFIPGHYGAAGATAAQIAPQRHLELGDARAAGDLGERHGHRRGRGA